MQVFGHLLVDAECCIGFGNLTFEFGYAVDADFFRSIGIAPDGQGYAPVAGTREVPVLEVFKPLTKTTFAGGGGFPVDRTVEFGHALFGSTGADEPGIHRVIQYGLIGTPAVRVVVHVFFHFKGPVFLF